MTNPDQLLIAEALVEKIRRHAAEDYPHECCGALLGRDVSSSEIQREILDLFPLVNRNGESPRNRFSVSPRDVIDAERVAQERGLDIVGWYHSHPDHPARPSEFDRQHAWPWYSYIIVSVRERVPQEMTSWRLNDDRDSYSEEVIQIAPLPLNDVDSQGVKTSHGR
jgi:proteasome lid subunit RPN8/RPN11